MDQLLPNSLNLIADPWKRGLGDDIILISFHYHSLPLALKARENDADEEEEDRHPRPSLQRNNCGREIFFESRLKHGSEGHTARSWRSVPVNEEISERL